MFRAAKSSTHRGQRGALLVAATGLLAGASILAPLGAYAATDDHGGAARNDGDKTAMIRDSIVDGPAKNVILLIGDGMGDSEITVARNYAEGAAGELAGIDALPLTGQYTTYALNEDGTPNYASESASTASGWSTGTKTKNGSLSVDINGTPQSTLLELAKANGLRTGDVSTAEIQDATPGAQVAHISARGCYGPVKTTENCASEALENGGLGSISEQLLTLRPDVVLGGGSATFTETAVAGDWAGQTLFEQATDRGYQLVNDAAGLDAITAADQSAPVLGLFTEGNFPTRWVGPEATVGGGDLAPVSCTANPERLATGLSLASLTDKAIDLLSADSEQGFFLQVEGASIDKRDHAADACGQIGETVDLDEAVQSALAFAKADGNTLVVVTADHAHTSQIVGSTPPGLSVALTTEEGSTMLVSYGTAEAGESQQHTGSQVRIAGYGPGAANVLGLTDQTDLFFTSANALELTTDLASLSAAATLVLDQATVAPGADFTAAGAGLAADWQATGEVSTSGAADPLGVSDVIDGEAVFTGTAPTEPGDYTVTLTGAQTGVAVSAVLTVAAAGVATPDPTPSASPTATAPAAVLPGADSGSGPAANAAAAAVEVLASTGVQLAPVAGLAAVLLAAGGALLVVRRRRHGLSH
ncbi:alkaline phosphatase [Cryobacterium sp. SO2]|uniref:alkaline phosphatase n=1 Tax=Cryobacterium sp. SO2 TaxID=1897060 RepID=UPI00223E7C5B|nr:alkaline phosphatase [Cryobacterium sp. SO2]WEO78457.1 alkaline phosphatase [Cryobacterium sp. SO2]